jgi:phosphate transport system substrate-binding protein
VSSGDVPANDTDRNTHVTRVSRFGVVASGAALTLALSACSSGASPSETPSNETPALALAGELNGAGSSAQQSAMEAWVATFQDANPDVTINYDPVGSGGGRTQFLDGAVSWAGSDGLMNADEYAAAVTRCGTDGAIHLPVYISPLAVLFNLDGISSLNLSSDVLAKIFDGQIAKWNDATIAADNPGVDLPNLAITVIHRSDDSGTTKNFTDYLHKTSTLWTYDAAGVWPNSVGEGGAQTSGVIDLLTGTVGGIGYADESRAGTFGVASIKVGDTWVAPSAEGSALVVDVSPLSDTANGANDLAYKLDRTTTEAGAYPLVLVSYAIVCQHYSDANERALVTSFLKYTVSVEGQATAASAAGSAPISAALSTQDTAILNEIAAG